MRSTEKRGSERRSGSKRSSERHDTVRHSTEGRDIERGNAETQRATRTGRGRAEGRPNQVFTQVRIDEDTFRRGKILAAIYDISFNRLMVHAIRNEIQAYEGREGALPEPSNPKSR